MSLTRILKTDEGTARYRTTALVVVSWAVTWIQNRFGFDLVEQLDDWLGFGEGPIHSGLVIVAAYALYHLSQHFRIVDELAHLGASKARIGGAPTYHQPAHAREPAPAPPVDDDPDPLPEDEYAAIVNDLENEAG